MSTGHLHKRQNVFIDPRHIGEAPAQFADDLRHAVLAIDLLENFPGAVVEFDHAFRVEQHMAVLHRLPLQAKAATQARHLLDGDLIHKVIPRCQTRAWVTVWYGGRSSS